MNRVKHNTQCMPPSTQFKLLSRSMQTCVLLLGNGLKEYTSQSRANCRSRFVIGPHLEPMVYHGIPWYTKESRLRPKAVSLLAFPVPCVWHVLCPALCVLCPVVCPMSHGMSAVLWHVTCPMVVLPQASSPFWAWPAPQIRKYFPKSTSVAGWSPLGPHSTHAYRLGRVSSHRHWAQPMARVKAQ